MPDKDETQGVSDGCGGKYADKAGGLKNGAAEGWSKHSGCVAGRRFQRHGWPQARIARDFTEHAAPHRKFCGPERAVQHGGEADMPKRQSVHEGEEPKDRGTGRQDNKTDDQEQLAIIAISEDAHRHTEEKQRCHAQKRHERNQRGRLGGLIGENADRQQFQPAKDAD